MSLSNMGYCPNSLWQETLCASPRRKPRAGVQQGSTLHRPSPVCGTSAGSPCFSCTHQGGCLFVQLLGVSMGHKQCAGSLLILLQGSNRNCDSLLPMSFQKYVFCLTFWWEHACSCVNWSLSVHQRQTRMWNLEVECMEGSKCQLSIVKCLFSFAPSSTFVTMV